MGTVELMSGSWMGHSSMDSSHDGAHTFLLLNSYTQERIINQQLSGVNCASESSHHHILYIHNNLICLLQLYFRKINIQFQRVAFLLVHHLLPWRWRMTVAWQKLCMYDDAEHCTVNDLCTKERGRGLSVGTSCLLPLLIDNYAPPTWLKQHEYFRRISDSVEHQTALRRDSEGLWSH